MNKHYTENKGNSEDNGFVIAILAVGVALVGIGTFLAVELLFP